MSSGDQTWPWKIHDNPPFIGDFPFSAMVISHDYHRHRWFPRPLSTIDLALPRHGAWDSWRLNSGNEQKHIKIKDTSQNWWDSDRKKMNTWLTSETGDFAWTKQDFTEEWRQKNNIPESLGVPLTGYSAGILWMISGRYIYGDIDLVVHEIPVEHQLRSRVISCLGYKNGLLSMHSGCTWAHVWSQSLDLRSAKHTFKIYCVCSSLQAINQHSFSHDFSKHVPIFKRFHEKSQLSELES
jgi:hypothetical protein